MVMIQFHLNKVPDAKGSNFC